MAMAAIVRMGATMAGKRRLQDDFAAIFQDQNTAVIQRRCLCQIDQKGASVDQC